jgi:uncharacterized protein (DUF58 family)
MIPREILKKVRQIEIRTRHIVTEVFAGQYHSAFKGQGMEFEEVREYVAGDDVRSIDWNVTARAGTPFIKKFVEEREMTVMLVVDVSASQVFGSSARLKRDVAAEMAAVLAFAAIRNQDKVGLLLHTDEVERYIPPAKGPRHVLRVVSEVLNWAPRSKGTRLGPAIEMINRVARRPGVVFFIGDFLTNEEFRRPLAITARRHDTVTVVLGDKREQAWPKAGLVEWEDAETGKRYLIDTSDNRTRQKFAAMQARRREQLLATLARAGTDALEIECGEPYEKAFHKFFEQRARRRQAA